MLRRRDSKKRAVAIVPLVFGLLATIAHASPADFGCGPIDMHNQHIDYNDGRESHGIHIVERGHFYEEVENLASHNPMGDIAYTLNRIPNHPRALYAMSRYYLENEDRYRRKGYIQPDCYFTWGIGFRPDDGMVRLLYGIFLHKDGRHEEALDPYQAAIEIVPAFAEAHYNLGLLYLDLDMPVQSREQAEIAYQLGYPLQGLKNRLMRAGAWAASPGSVIAGEEAAAADTSP